MNKNILLALTVSMLLLFRVSYAQPYQTVTIDGFNHDVIANGVGTAFSTTTADVDGNNFCFKSVDWKLTTDSAPQTFGFPVNGNIISEATSGLSYQLQNYAVNNAIRLIATENTITSLVMGSVKAQKLFILATSGGGSAELDCVITFQDNTTESILTNPIPDWYSGTNPPPAYIGFGRLQRLTNDVEDSSVNPRLYQIKLSISVPNQLKEIKSIQFTRNNNSVGVINIFAVSAELLGTCPGSQLVTFDAITGNTATATLTEPAIVPANGYNYEIRTSGLPGSGNVGLITSGDIPAVNTTINLTGLPSSLTLQFYIRSNCSTTDQGVWSGPFVFTMACDTIGAFMENFDSTPVGTLMNPTIPHCWSFIDTGLGYGYVSLANPASIPNSFSIYNSSDVSGNYILISPKTDNLGNGAYRVKFKAKSSWGTSVLIFGKMTSNTDAGSFTAIGLPITLSAAYTEHIIDMPLTSDDYFAFKHGLGGTYRGIHIDDVVFEPIPLCQMDDPVIDADQIVCTETPVNNITVATTSDAVIKWYASATGSEEITTISTSGMYYVQTTNAQGCISERVPVNISVIVPVLPSFQEQQFFCNSATVANLSAIPTSGLNIKWYATADNETDLPANHILQDGNIYYVSQGISGCESERGAVTVHITPQTGPVISPFAFCGPATVADLQLTAMEGVVLKWYDSVTSTVELSQNTPLSTATYYAVRVENSCVSERVAVDVTISDIPASPTGSLDQSFTVNTLEEATIADLVMDQANIFWFTTYEDALNNNNRLPVTTPLVSGQNYYGITVGTTGCLSQPTTVLVNITLGTDNFDKTQLVCYPNPTTDILNIRYKQAIDAVTVYNSVGQKVMTKTFDSNQIQLDMNGFSAGNYLIELHSKNQIQIIKVIKK